MATSRSYKLLSPRAQAFSLQDSLERRERLSRGLDAFYIMRTALIASIHVILTLPLNLQGKGYLPCFTDDENKDSKRLRLGQGHTPSKCQNQDSNLCFSFFQSPAHYTTSGNRILACFSWKMTSPSCPFHRWRTWGEYGEATCPMTYNDPGFLISRQELAITCIHQGPTRMAHSSRSIRGEHNEKIVKNKDTFKGSQQRLVMHSRCSSCRGARTTSVPEGTRLMPRTQRNP